MLYKIMGIKKKIFCIFFYLKLYYFKKRGFEYGRNCKFVTVPHFSDEPYLVKIGNNVQLSNDVQFITHDGAHWVTKSDRKYYGCINIGTIKIGNNVFIGARSTILAGVNIGDNVIIGACSLVTKDCEDNSVYAGNPAKKIESIEKYKQKIINKKLPSKLFYDFEHFRINEEKLQKYLSYRPRTFININ
ncbi:MAG: acyltransferase [Deltaproteobacteria bacterium]|nr:acyltransferase [Deltaproteobacteria bacterium]